MNIKNNLMFLFRFLFSRSKLKELAVAEDFSDYKKLLQTSVRISRYVTHFEMKEVLNRKIYFAYVQFVNRPKAFDDSTQLAEVDRLHIDLYKQSPHSLFKAMASRREYR